MRVAVFSVLLAFSMSALALAETPGSLTGVVVDATTQSPIGDVQVTARSPSLIGEQAAITDGGGTAGGRLLHVYDSAEVTAVSGYTLLRRHVASSSGRAESSRRLSTEAR